MNKKGQSISINTIIIAAIALAVLVVLFAIFTGRIGGFTRGVTDTDTCAQKCIALNLQKIRDLNVQGQDCNPTEQKISGSYTDGKYGCCCNSIT